MNARVLECHGTLNFMQCGEPCSNGIWASGSLMDGADIDALAPSALPRCPQCGHLARPNFLLFDDNYWIETRTSAQWERLRIWLRPVQRPVVVEIGAGTAVPSVCMFAESVRGPLTRINLDESELAGKGVGLRGAALDVLSAVDAALVACG